MTTFNAYATDAGGGVTPLATDQTALATIIAMLPYCDTVDLRELQLNHVPRERSRAVNSESRTRPVRLTEPQTVAIPIGAVQREYNRAVLQEHGEGELD